MDFHGFRGRVARPSVVFACPRVAPALVVFAFLMWLGLFTFFVISVVARALAGLPVAPAVVMFACPRVAPALVVLASRVARALVLFAFSSVARAAAPLRVPDAI